MNNKKTVKRLFLDVETSYSVMASFSLWPKFIPHTNIIKDWHIICASWKWEGEDEIHNALTYTESDKKVVKALREAIHEADELVYHNGKKFDWKKINTRVLMNGLPPMVKPRETDTLTQCRKHFAFTSNRLDYIGQVLVDDCKMNTKPGLWMEALNKNKEAINEMQLYCDQDVVLLEKVFQKIRAHVDVGFNANLLDNDEDVCHNCNSNDLQKRGFAYTKTAKYQRYQCKVCGSWSQSGRKEPSNVKMRK